MKNCNDYAYNDSELYGSGKSPFRMTNNSSFKQLSEDQRLFSSIEGPFRKKRSLNASSVFNETDFFSRKNDPTALTAIAKSRLKDPQNRRATVSVLEVSKKLAKGQLPTLKEEKQARKTMSVLEKTNPLVFSDQPKTPAAMKPELKQLALAQFRKNFDSTQTSFGPTREKLNRTFFNSRNTVPHSDVFSSEGQSVMESPDLTVTKRKMVFDRNDIKYEFQRTSLQLADLLRKRGLSINQPCKYSSIKGPDYWDDIQKNVISDLGKKMFVSEKKVKEVVQARGNESELEPFLDRKARSIYEFLGVLTAEEREKVLLHVEQVAILENPTPFLLDRVQAVPQNKFEDVMQMIYSFLLSKHCKKIHSSKVFDKLKVGGVSAALRKKMKENYDFFIMSLRKRHHDLMEEQQAGEGDRYLSQFNIMCKQKALGQKRSAIEDKRVVEYVKYLIDQQQNNDFILARSEFEQCFELHTKSLAMNFNHYAEKEDNTMKMVANDLLERVEYNEVCKNLNKPIVPTLYKDEPKYHYFMACAEEMISAIPVLAKIVNKNLTLNNYRFDIAICKGLRAVCEMRPDLLTRCLFQNNGLKDEEFSILLQGLQALSTVIQIIYRNNEIGQKSIANLGAIFLRRSPNHLQVLRFANCKMHSSTTFQLLKLLNGQSMLRTLGLCKVEFDEQCVGELVLYIIESQSLRELDLSWNNFSQRNYLRIIDAIAENSKLFSINLSWNNLFTVNTSSIEWEKVCLENVKKHSEALKKGTQMPIEALKHQRRFSIGFTQKLSGRTADSEKSTAQSRDLTIHEMVQIFQVPTKDPSNVQKNNTQIIEKLFQMIKSNRKLQHLDVGHTGMPILGVLKVGQAMKKSLSLIGVHLDGNPGSTQENKDLLFKYLVCKPVEKRNKIIMREIEGSNSQRLHSQLENQMDEFGDRPLARDTIQLRQLMKQKEVDKKTIAFTQEAEPNRLTLTRMINFKEHMPGSGQWVMLTERDQTCWICDQHIYTLIFWQRESIGIASAKTTQPDVLQKLIKEVQAVNGAPKKIRVPTIFGPFTNWQPKEMMPVSEFALMLDGRKGSQKKQEEQKRKLIQKIQKHEKATQGLFYKARVLDIAENWKQMIQQNLEFRKPCFVNANLLPSKTNQSSDGVFVFPVLLRAGKYPYLVQDDDLRFFQHQMIADYRTEEIPVFTKSFNKQVIAREFRKEHSVFHPWKPDSPESLSKVVQEGDSTQMKVFQLIKDPKDQDETFAVCAAHMLYLKTLHLEMSCEQSYPCVLAVQIPEFVKKAKLVDKKAVLADFDIKFTSAIQAPQKGQIKPGLGRIDFIEFLIRIAVMKYVASKQIEKVSVALQKLITEDLQPNCFVTNWQSWRDNELWTKEVNDVMFANLATLNKFFESFWDYQMHWLPVRDALNILTVDTKLGFSQKQAQLCFALSKMTIPNEKESWSDYNRMQFVEMLEMFGRAAVMYYDNNPYLVEVPLSQKIELILDIVFEPYGLVRKPVTENDFEEESQSDNDY